MAKGAEARRRRGARRTTRKGNNTVYRVVFIIPLHTTGISYEKIKIKILQLL